jgi:ribose 5-phosphate isomerase A
MVVGLGHGSTARFALEGLSIRLNSGALVGILGIACSRQVESEARRLGIPLTTIEDHPAIDVTIDGADEVDPDLNLIKGAGGALLREKIVAQISRREIIIVDSTKLSSQLGTLRAVPVEVVPFGWRSQVHYLESLGARVAARTTDDGSLFRSDQGNFILDCEFGPILDVPKLAGQIKGRTGIVEHGLFVGMATDVVISGPDGIRHLRK